MKNYIYIHTACLPNGAWKEIYDDIISFVPINERENITSIVLGEHQSHPIINPTVIRNVGGDYDEVATLQAMWNCARYLKEDAIFYYLHLKGNTHTGESRKNCDSWRRFMCDLMFRDMSMNERLLKNHDCLGSMLLNNPLHYQGNFFVCTSSHLKRLPYIMYHKENRYHESWVTCIQGKYVNLSNNYALVDLYNNKINPKDHQIDPSYIEQVQYPHGACVQLHYPSCKLN